MLANVSIAQQAITKYSKIKTKRIFADNFVDNKFTLLVVLWLICLWFISEWHTNIYTHTECVSKHVCLMPFQQDGSYGNRSIWWCKPSLFFTVIYSQTWIPLLQFWLICGQNYWYRNHGPAWSWGSIRPQTKIRDITNICTKASNWFFSFLFMLLVCSRAL